MNLEKGDWINAPRKFALTESTLALTTDPETDFWQRTYYGFQNDNAPAFLFEEPDNFTFTAKVDFQYQALFDQAGIIVYLDQDNWCKASAEFEKENLYRLGSVVTNFGHSDWATTDIESTQSLTYRLSRRGPDFLIEVSFDNRVFHQMRILHLHCLGDTSQKMGAANPPVSATNSVKFGLYACSPTNSSFTATFSDIKLQECIWKAHQV